MKKYLLFLGTFNGSRLDAQEDINQHDGDQLRSEFNEEPDDATHDHTHCDDACETVHEDDGGDISGPTVFAEVCLAKTIGTYISAVLFLSDCNESIVVRRMKPTLLADTLNCPDLPYLIQSFLHEQLNPSMLSSLSSNDSMLNLPPFDETLSIYTSAVAKFYAPSDLCGIGGMRFECIHATSKWRGSPRNDCVFVETDSMAARM